MRSQRQNQQQNGPPWAAGAKEGQEEEKEDHGADAGRAKSAAIGIKRRAEEQKWGSARWKEQLRTQPHSPPTMRRLAALIAAPARSCPPKGAPGAALTDIQDFDFVYFSSERPPVGQFSTRIISM